MKNNNGNNTWINLFLFFLVIDKPETVLDLIQSDNCEKEFTDIVQRIVTMDSKRFQHTCIDWLMKHREKLMELNKVYKTNLMRLPSVTPKAESCEDDISRQVVHDIWHTTYPTVRIGNEEIQYKKIAYDLPSVTPQQTRWIPCSERLPKENEYIGNVCKYYLIQDEYGDMHVAHLSNVGWIPMDSLKAIGDEIIAWMPLPEPYKAESEEE